MVGKAASLGSGTAPGWIWGGALVQGTTVRCWVPHGSTRLCAFCSVRCAKKTWQKTCAGKHICCWEVFGYFRGSWLLAVTSAATKKVWHCCSCGRTSHRMHIWQRTFGSSWRQRANRNLCSGAPWICWIYLSLYLGFHKWWYPSWMVL